MEERYNKIEQWLEKSELDAVLISNGYNMRYFSGFSGATGYLYISRYRKAVITDFRYTFQAKQESAGYEIIEVQTDYETIINDLLATEQVKQLAFEAKEISYAEYLDWKEKLRVEQLIPIQDEMTEFRSIKTEQELAYIKKAEQIGDIAFSKILDILKPGMTEVEVAAHLEFIMKQNGAEGLSFDTIVASGIHSSMPHAVPTQKKIELGDFITMDFGCVYQGYCSDMTRTIVLGKASAQQKKVYQTVLEAQQEALHFIKAGYQGKEIDGVARAYINQAGYEGCFGHGLGHSVGLFIHENPRLSAREEGLILENMVETVEPGIYIEKFGGVRIEDLVVVTKEGHINFTSSEKRLIEL